MRTSWYGSCPRLRLSLPHFREHYNTYFTRTKIKACSHNPSPPKPLKHKQQKQPTKVKLHNIYINMASETSTMRRPDPPADIDLCEYFSNHLSLDDGSSASSHSTTTSNNTSALETEIRCFDKWQEWVRQKERRIRKDTTAVNDPKHDLLADHVDDCVALFMQFRLEKRNKRHGIRRQAGQRRGLLDP